MIIWIFHKYTVLLHVRYRTTYETWQSSVLSKLDYFTVNREFHELRLLDKETIRPAWRVIRRPKKPERESSAPPNYGVRIWTLTSFNGLESNALKSTERHIGRSRQSDSIVET